MTRWIKYGTSDMLLLFLLLCLAFAALVLLRYGMTNTNSLSHREYTPLAKPRIIIHKSDRHLYLYDANQLIRSYPIGIGPNPKGDKIREGDGRTPEGEYFICAKNPYSKFLLSLALSYPNICDAQRGLENGFITEEDFRSIAKAQKAGSIPPWNTALGGEIFIHGHGSNSNWTLGCIALENEHIEELYHAVKVGTPVIIYGETLNKKQIDPFKNAEIHPQPTLQILSRIESRPWSSEPDIYPLKRQVVYLKVEPISDAAIRWMQIFPDLSEIYNNANLPWEDNPYKWKGFAKIKYNKRELKQFRDCWCVQLFGSAGKIKPADKNKPHYNIRQNWASQSQFYHHDVGSFWFQAEVAKGGIIYRSPGPEDSDKRGLSPKVFRVSVRNGEHYIGWLSTLFNVPAVFGSVTYQSTNYIGVDCADVLMAAYSKWKNKPLSKNYNVAMLVNQFPVATQCRIENGVPDKKLRWKEDIRKGYFIAVRYNPNRQYQHIGALFEDSNQNGLLDEADLIIHAGPYPLHLSALESGNFNGLVTILRP